MDGSRIGGAVGGGVLEGVSCGLAHRDHDVGGLRGTDIMIAAGEAAANAFEHAAADRPADAGPVQITLTARTEDTVVRLTVADTGSWRPPPADRQQPAPGTRGHGMIFMHALMDDVRIDPSAHGTTVTLTKDLKP